MAYTLHTRSTATMDTWAHELVSADHDAPELRCDACGRMVDTHLHAHEPDDGAYRAILEFLQHCRYDHNGPARVSEYRPTSSTGWRD